MMQQTKKYFLFVSLAILVVSFIGIFAPSKVEAGPGGGPQCYINIQSIYYRKTSCPTDGSVDPNSTGCYFKGDSDRLGRNSFTAIDCGTVIQKNNECVTNNCYDGATADGSGRPAKNNRSEAPTPITNEDRDKLANCDGTTDPQKCLEDNPLVTWTQYAINVLAAGVGVVVTVMIIIGGMQYASAGPNPQAVLAAKKKIANAIIALVAFFFLYAFLQYLIPGGVF